MKTSTPSPALACCCAAVWSAPCVHAVGVLSQQCDYLSSQFPGSGLPWAPAPHPLRLSSPGCCCRHYGCSQQPQQAAADGGVRSGHSSCSSRVGGRPRGRCRCGRWDWWEPRCLLAPSRGGGSHTRVGSAGHAVRASGPCRAAAAAAAHVACTISTTTWGSVARQPAWPPAAATAAAGGLGARSDAACSS